MKPNQIATSIALFAVGTVALLSVGEIFLLDQDLITEVPPTEEQIFAEIDANGVVLRTIVITQDKINTGLWGDPANWKQTSASGTIRKNQASKGHTYDRTRDAFVPPKPQSIETTFNESTANWDPPAPITYSSST